MRLRPDIVLLACIVVLAVVLCTRPVPWTTSSFVIDDALYYPRVAMNVVAGHGITYDGHTHTNGFHPLWAVMNLVPAALAGGDPTRMLRGCFILSAALAVGGAILLVAIGRRLRWGAAGTTIALALLIFPRTDLWMSLMEACASMGMLLLTLYLCLRLDLLTTERRGRAVLFGVLMALVFFVRLDLVFVVAVFFAGSLVVRRRAGQPWSRALSRVTIAGGVALACVLPYLIANVVAFGHPVPVSGRKKHEMGGSVRNFIGSINDPLRRVGVKTGLPTAVVGVGALAAIGAGVWTTRAARRTAGAHAPRFATGGVLPVYAIGVAARWTYLRVFMTEESYRVPWYWVPEFVLGCLIVGYGVGGAATWLKNQLAARRPALGRLFESASMVAPVLALLLAAGGTMYVVRDAARQRPDGELLMAAGAWANEHLPADAVCAMYDSGYFSYFSQRDTIGLNGLIADGWTMKQSEGKHFNAILDRFGVGYVAIFLNDRELEPIPLAARVYVSPRRIQTGYHRGRHLCIIDRRIRSPYQT